jgi:SPP1 gp7 family putative phage head morphogenesis protein
VADPTAGISPDPIKFDEAIKAIRRRVPMTEDVWSQLEQDELEFAFTVADVAQLDMVVDVYEAIQRAVENGTTLDDFKAEVGDGLEAAWGEEDGARLEGIFRTNVQGAYNAGRHEAAQAVKEERPYWRYQAIRDARTAEMCLDADGTVLPADDPWWQNTYPPLHTNCRCEAVTLTEAQAEREGISDSGPNVEPQEGFGQAPSGAGGDWEPDPTDYPDDLASELEDKLAEDTD